MRVVLGGLLNCWIKVVLCWRWRCGRRCGLYW